MIFPFTLNWIYSRINLADSFHDTRVGVRGGGGGYSDFFMNIFKEKREILNMWYTEPGREKFKKFQFSYAVKYFILIIDDFELNQQ